MVRGLKIGLFKTLRRVGMQNQVRNGFIMAGIVLSALMIVMGIFPQEVNLYFENFRMWIFSGSSHPEHLAHTFPWNQRLYLIAMGVGFIAGVIYLWKGNRRKDGESD